MDRYSWSNRKLPGAMIAPDNESMPGGLTHGICYCCQEMDVIPAPLTRNFYVIGRAYNEPCTLNMIEDLLLQRNFIID